MSHEVEGGCLCGAIRFTARLPGHDLSACWCSQCRAQCSGPLVCTMNVEAGSLAMTGTPATYRASDHATRGFCAACGSTLYWQADGEEPGFSLGALDARDGYRIVRVVHPEDRPDFVDLEART